MVEDLLAPARMWGDAEAEAKLWAHLAREAPAIPEQTPLGAIPAWFLAPLPTGTIEVQR